MFISAPSTAAIPAPEEPALQQISPRQREALTQFEAIFMRQLLGSLEKAGSLGGKGGLGAGTGVYGSMMVGALADSTAESGGIGLAALLAESLKAQLLSDANASHRSETSHPKPDSG